MAVSVYSTPTCVYCSKVKDYLREHQVGFVDYDISRDERKADEMIHKSRQMHDDACNIEKSFFGLLFFLFVYDSSDYRFIGLF